MMTRKNVRAMGYPRCTLPPYGMARGQVPAAVGAPGMPNEMPTVGVRSLAMVYPEWQEFRELYTPDAALCRGTLFKELDKPFCY